MTEPEYRQDDTTDGSCPRCGQPLTAMTTGARGYCETHGWQFADWTAPTDPLDGRCARCGQWYDQHPGGFCPDQVGTDGMVEIATAESFVPLDDAPSDRDPGDETDEGERRQ